LQHLGCRESVSSWHDAINVETLSQDMKIAIVGCGAVGSYYGAKLIRSGLEVHFLLRSDYQTVLRDGIKVQSFEGDF